MNITTQPGRQFTRPLDDFLCQPVVAETGQAFPDAGFNLPLPLLVPLAFALVFFAIAVLRFRRRFA